MKINFIIFFSSIILFSCFEIDFTIKNDSNAENNDVINALETASLEINLSFGEKNDKFNSRVNLNNYAIAVPGTEVTNQNIQKFNASDSDTFKTLENLPFISSENVLSGVLGEDKINIQKTEIKEMKFVVGSLYSSSSLNDYTYIGLSLSTNERKFPGINILEQLKSKNIIDKQTWYLKFDNYNKGKLVLGKYLHEMNNEYNEEDMVSINLCQKYGEYYRLDFDEINYGNKNEPGKRVIMEKHNTTLFSITTRLIYSTYEFGKTIHSKFFKEKIENKNPKCFSKTLKENSQYIYYYCTKEININEMENLNFVLKEKNITFTLEPKDLFYEENDYFYYLIVYKNFEIDDANKDTEWIFGLQFLQKFNIAFNRDDKIAYFYNKEIRKEDSEDDDKETKYIIIIVLIIIIFIGCIGFLVFYIIKIKPRKKKANELDEGFDYESKNDNLNEKKEDVMGISK